MNRLEKIAEELFQAALAYPEAYEERPWGERVCKVNKKIFFFVGARGQELGLSAKLPRSASMALGFPFAKPTPYGLGKAGWVSASFAAQDDVPVPLLLEWLDESYRAIAPKKLVAQLSGEPKAAVSPAPSKKKKPARRGKPVLLVGDDDLRL